MGKKNKRHISQWIGICGIIIPVIFGSISYSYWKIPGFRNFVDLNIIDNSYWLYVGEVNKTEERWLRYQTTQRPIRNFYYHNWQGRKKITSNIIESAVGKMVFHDVENMVVKHAAPYDAPNHTDFKSTPNIGNSKKADCYHVRRVIMKPYKYRSESRFNVWMYATELTCS